PNYDNSTKEPIVLPTRIPNLLVNGSSGIAVGMATNVPPHNLLEVSDACIKLIDNPNLNVNELMEIVKGPDFPTGSIICGKAGIKRAYETGQGKITVKAKIDFEEGKRNRIVVTEIPYMLNKSLLIEDIANKVQDGVIEGISDIRDESDRKGLRIVFELKQNISPEVVVNQLLKHSNLKVTFGINMLALVDGVPRVLGLKDLLQYFILHRKDVVVRRTKFELDKARDRAHILLGLKVALSNIDAVIKTIKSSKDAVVAKDLLIQRFKLSEKQSEAILEMRLQRLTSLETNKIIEEHAELLKKIEEYKGILASEEKVFNIIKDELIEIREAYGKERKTEITDELVILEDADLIPEEDVVVTVTHSGYIKRIPITSYKSQRRGGKGMVGTGTKEEDFVENLFITNTHNYLLFFTNKGKLHWLKAYDLPEAGRYSTGKAIVNLLKLEKDEKVTTLIPVKDFGKGYLVMVTKNGLIKKTQLKLFSNPRSNGIRCINLRNKDELIKALWTDGFQKLILATANGMASKFDEINIRPMGRGAAGVKAMRLKAVDKVIGMGIAKDELTLLSVTENGYGKRTIISDYRLIRRGGGGVINIKTTPRNGKVVAIQTVDDKDELFLITSKGIMLRTKVKNVSQIGRNTQGVRIIKLNPGDKLNSIAKIIVNGE
ncbi:MAG: DNA gyrase subunit A, partial [Nanoarchaeota archaeon]|nr:DNA gyrase subunit A [Nanoarchaeota archaeon]